MNFSSTLAQNITEELKTVVNQDINYFNSKGYIIASTNKDRIGDFHQGAKKVLETKKELIVKYDNEFIGSRKGINLPVYFNNDVVGVIGITGEKSQVEHYGKIIQKITQILIKDAYLQEQKLREEETKRQFFEELLFKENEELEFFVNWAEILNIKLNRQRVVVMINILDGQLENILASELYEKIYKLIEKNILVNKENIVIQSGKNIIIIYSPSLKDGLDTRKQMEKVLDLVEDKYENIGLKIGIGSPVDSLLNIRDSYLQAKRALNIISRSKVPSIKSYEELDLEIIVDSVDPRIKEFYMSKVFKNLSPGEIQDLSKNFLAYFKHNGSIKNASEALFIHKNTLQYRLNSIHRETGYNPRKLEDMVVLYLGFMLAKYN